jgi:multisubunit Na+/H+ antiporter MnhB subunit
MQSLILRTATRILAALILVFSVYLLIRGHNAPGGGFSGALVAGTGFSLYIIAEGAALVRQAIRVDPRGLIVFGIGLAIFSGMIGPLLGKPFLTGIWWTLVDLPDYQLKVGTPFFFDIGVYAIVLGTILAVVLGLEEN